MSHLKSNHSMTQWKLIFHYSSNGVPLTLRNKLNINEYNQVKIYKSLKKCPHDNLIEKHCSHVSYIENNLPLVCQTCGLVGHNLEVFSDKGSNPLYGTYY